MSKDLEACLRDFASELGCAADNEAILRAIEDLKEREVWRPIATAPKDGKAILGVWKDQTDKSHVGICWWAGSWCPYARTLVCWQPVPAPPSAVP